MTAKPRPKRDARRVPIDLRSLGPKMRALPNDMWRAAAVARFMVKGASRGKNTAACRVAGFGNAEGTTPPSSMKQIAYRIFHDRRMLEALHELGEQYQDWSHQARSVQYRAASDGGKLAAPNSRSPSGTVRQNQPSRRVAVETDGDDAGSGRVFAVAGSTAMPIVTGT